MRKRSVRRYKAGGAVPVASVVIDDDKIKHDFPETDNSASSAFQKQVDALRAAEAHRPAQSPEQEQEAAYRDLEQAFERGDEKAQAAATERLSKANTRAATQHDLTERQQAFVDANPDMIAEPDRLVKAIVQAHQQGFAPDSHEFHAATAANFRNQHLEVASHNKATFQGHQPGSAEHHKAASDNLDGFIADLSDNPPSKRSPRTTIDDDDTDRRRGRIVSAPVSRETMGTMGGRYGGDRPGSVTMTPAMKDAARISGISERAYAEQVLELRRRKENGDYTGSP